MKYSTAWSSRALDVFLAAGVSRKTGEAAVVASSRGDVHLLSFSGKIASGKDTMSELVLDALGVPTNRRLNLKWATALRVEIDEILSILRACTARREAADIVSATMHVSPVDADRITEILWSARASGVTAYSRRDDIRNSLQAWGTDIRRRDNTDYWIDAGLRSIAHALSLNHSVALTDVRFPNEEEALQRAGFYSVRLDISPEVQATRLAGRDGLTTDASITHISETLLDDWSRFALRVSNDADPTVACAAIVAGYTEFCRNN